MKNVIVSVFAVLMMLISSCVNYNSLLKSAISEKNIDEARECFACGANVNYRYTFGVTPLILAVENHDVSMVEFVLKNGAVIDAQDMMGRTALMAAVDEGNNDILLYLLKNGADLKIKDNQNANALVRLCGQRAKENIEIIKILIKNGLDVNSTDNFASALYYAITNNKYETVKLLLENGTNVNLGCTSGTSPLSLAKLGDKKIVDLLVKYGAKTSEELQAGKKTTPPNPIPLTP